VHGRVDTSRLENRNPDRQRPSYSSNGEVAWSVLVSAIICVDKPEIMEILNGSSEVGHPLGASELVSSTIDIPNLIDALAERKYVAEIEQDISVTKAGRRERTKIRTKPRESVVSKLLNRFKITLKANISTKDIWPR
jgi:hypothetical protein